MVVIPMEKPRKKQVPASIFESLVRDVVPDDREELRSRTDTPQVSKNDS